MKEEATKLMILRNVWSLELIRLAKRGIGTLCL